jgi:hypothetical protein
MRSWTSRRQDAEPSSSAISSICSERRFSFHQWLHHGSPMPHITSGELTSIPFGSMGGGGGGESEKNHFLEILSPVFSFCLWDGVPKRVKKNITAPSLWPRPVARQSCEDLVHIRWILPWRAYWMDCLIMSSIFDWFATGLPELTSLIWISGLEILDLLRFIILSLKRWLLVCSSIFSNNGQLGSIWQYPYFICI